MPTAKITDLTIHYSNQADNCELSLGGQISTHQPGFQKPDILFSTEGDLTGITYYGALANAPPDVDIGVLRYIKGPSAGVALQFTMEVHVNHNAYGVAGGVFSGDEGIRLYVNDKVFTCRRNPSMPTGGRLPPQYLFSGDNSNYIQNPNLVTQINTSGLPVVATADANPKPSGYGVGWYMHYITVTSTALGVPFRCGIEFFPPSFLNLEQSRRGNIKLGSNRLSSAIELSTNDPHNFLYISPQDRKPHGVSKDSSWRGFSPGHDKVVVNSAGRYTINSKYSGSVIIDVNPALLPASDSTAHGLSFYPPKNDLFSSITSRDLALGRKDYICLFVKNNSTYPTANPIIVHQVDLPTGSSTIKIGVDPAGKGNGFSSGIPSKIPNKNTPPAGVTFVGATSELSGVVLASSLGAGECVSFWLERTTPAGSSESVPEDSFSIGIVPI